MRLHLGGEVTPKDIPILGLFFEYAGWWIPAVIVVSFLFAIWRYLRPIWRSSRALARAIRDLDAGANDEMIFQKAPRFLSDLWKDYLQRRRGASVAVSEGTQSTVAPEEVFTEHAVLKSYNRKIAGTLAGIFTGLGILGTFIGLVNGLGTIRSAESQAVLDSVVGMLGGMSTAFYTSIWGIFFSLVWLVLDRAAVHTVERQAARFFEATKLRYPVASGEWFLHRLYEVERSEHQAIERSEKLLEEQKAILQTLGTDLALAFDEALQNTFSTQFAPALESVAASIAVLETQLGDRQVDAMRRLVATFQERLSQQLGGQFEHLQAAMQNAAEWQERVHQELGELIERLQLAADGQREVIERAAAACDRYQETLGDLSDSHSLIRQSAESVKDAATMISARLEASAKALTEELREAVDWATALTQNISSGLQGLTEQTQAIAERIEQLDAQQETYREANTEIRTFLASHLDNLNEQIQFLTSFWGQLRQDLTSMGDGIRSSVQEFSVFTAEKLKEIFVRFDSEMATVVEHLGGTLAELREVTEDLPGGVERLRGTLAEATRPIGEVNQGIVHLSHAMGRLESLAVALKSLEPLGGQLERFAQQMDGTDRSILRLSERLESTDRRIASVLSHVSGPGGGNGDGATIRPPAPSSR